jgi:hypothetical protein
MRVLMVASVGVAMSCGDSTSPGSVSGSLSFTHSGAISGTFNASGSVLVADPEAVQWAAASRDNTNDGIDISARIPRASNTNDNILIFFPQQTTGSVDAGTEAIVIIGFGVNESGSATWLCGLDAGTVTVATISSTRVTGTFSGTGDCIASGGGAAAFTVTNGSFNVPLIDGGSIP